MTACKQLYGDAGLRALLIEQVAVIVDALPDGMTFDQWYSDEMAQLDVLTEHKFSGYALGYLRGAHEACNVTLMELLDEHGIDPDQCGTSKPARKLRKRGKVRAKK